MQIFFRKLAAKNTWSYKELDLDLSKKGLCIITGINRDAGGSNGSGKSAIPRIFFYGITGATSEGLKTEDILSDFLPKNSEVIISFAIGEREYVIERYRNHSKYEDKLILKEDGKDISLKLKADTQKKIYDIMGVDRDSLLLLTLFSTDSINFAKVPAAERRRSFLSLFPNIEKYKEVYALKFKTSRNAIQDNLTNNGQELFKLKTSIETNGEMIDKIEQHKRAIERELADAERTYQESDTRKKEEELITLINNGMEQLKKKYPAKIIENIDRISSGLDKITKRWDGFRQDIHMLEIEKKGFEKDIEHTIHEISTQKDKRRIHEEELLNGECTHCGTKFNITTPPPRIEKELSKLESFENELEKKREHVAQVIIRINEDIDAKTKEYKAAEAQKNLFNNVMLDLEKIGYWKEQQMQITPEILALEGRIESLKEDIVHQNEMLEDFKYRINEDQTKYNTMLEEKANLETKNTYYDYLYKISSLDIPTYLLNKYLAILEEESSSILRRLFNGMSLKISDTYQNKKGTEKPELTIGIDNMIGLVKDYKTFSGGEKQAIDISLLFGIQRLVSRETGSLPNILFLDEILDISADDVRTQNIVEFLHEEARLYDSMFLISHKSTLTEESDSSIVVTKENGISTINVA